MDAKSGVPGAMPSASREPLVSSEESATQPVCSQREEEVSAEGMGAAALEYRPWSGPRPAAGRRAQPELSAQSAHFSAVSKVSAFTAGRGMHASAGVEEEEAQQGGRHAGRRAVATGICAAHGSARTHTVRRARHAAMGGDRWICDWLMTAAIHRILTMTLETQKK